MTLDRMEGTFLKNEQQESPGTALKKKSVLVLTLEKSTLHS